MIKERKRTYTEQAYVCYENPKMQGCLYLLEKIKSNLEKNGTGA